MQSQFNSPFVGLDVSKPFLDVCVVGPHEPRSWRVVQEPAAHAALVAELVELQPQLIVIEATGRYELPIVEAMLAAGLPVVVINPKRVRDFAKSRGILAKTDTIDAYVIALFAAQIQPALRQLPSTAQRALAACTAYQQKLVGDRASLRIQLGRAGDELIAASLLRRIEQLDEECRLLEAEIDARIAACDLWYERAQLARTAPGVGKQVARTLVAEMPELGALEDRQAASLAGLAPFNCDSGESRGRRRIRGGRGRVRRMLYLAARTAVRVELGYRQAYEKFLARGKAANAALIAIARKLLIALNHMLRDNRPFESRFPA
jgi:transposase